MADPAPSPTRSTLLRIAAAVAALAALAGALRLGGAFDDDEPVDPAPIAAPAAKPPGAVPKPKIETFEVGGHPGAIAVGKTGVFVADAFSDQLTLIEPHGEPSDVLSLRLPYPTNAVAASGQDLWLGYPDPRAVERRVAGTRRVGDEIELDAFPSDIAADPSGAWVLVSSGVDRVDAESAEVTDHLAAGGFATAFDVADGSIWVVADNREVRRFDASSLEAADEIAEVPDASAIAVGEGYAWVLSATGELTRLDTESLRRVGEPLRVPGALAFAVGAGAVWVTSSDRTATRVDPESGRTVGRPVRVGDEPLAVSAAADEIWVASAGDGTVTRITP